MSRQIIIGAALMPEDLKKLIWQSDFDSEDLGFPAGNVVGYYIYKDVNFYIDSNNGRVLEVWIDEEDE